MRSPFAALPLERNPICDDSSKTQEQISRIDPPVPNREHMDIDNPCQEAVGEPQAQNDQGQLKSLNCSTSASPENTTGCFDCNICLDFAQDPIVTLCGHLYCWSCIYKWISHNNSSPQQCPVCKAGLSQATMVPLYGRGDNPTRAADHETKGSSTSHLDIPQRPSAYRADTVPASPQPQQQQYDEYHQHEPYHYNHNMMAPYPYNHNMMAPATSLGGRSPRLFQSMSGVFGETVIAMLPWVFGYPEARLYYSSPYYFAGSGNASHLRRREMQAERSLGRILTFLFCCAVLCLLLF